MHSLIHGLIFSSLKRFYFLQFCSWFSEIQRSFWCFSLFAAFPFELSFFRTSFTPFCDFWFHSRIFENISHLNLYVFGVLGSDKIYNLRVSCTVLFSASQKWSDIFNMCSTAISWDYHKPQMGHILIKRRILIFVSLLFMTQIGSPTKDPATKDPTTKDPSDKIPQRQKTPPTKYPKFDHTSIINYLTLIYCNIL